MKLGIELKLIATSIVYTDSINIHAKVDENGSKESLNTESILTGYCQQRTSNYTL